ncbi:hypothetical protein DS2_13689 [Catenovulum agarivorans DS-2]|uniref:Glycoside hydrolase family 42 N-terminal domain-containing protein n=1 Tax=Catenovulum agarivorans DS-2 TaxID=1328313 RepID=W7QJR6_9ALTE|nr:alpha-amylase family protein [Catenovulum agarivorans]EWH09217.1 hypothetical protein DS2_13689 [Catenovulum agarivorans DS-2]
MSNINFCKHLLAAMIAAACVSCGSQTQVPNAQAPSTQSPETEASLTLKETALQKIHTLEALMLNASDQGIDVTREETAVWFAKEFLKYADWDEANPAQIEKFFESYSPFKEQKSEYASYLPQFEREQVIVILDKGIDALTKVLAGEITRRPVAKVDWQNIDVKQDMFVSKGKPIFLYDYFSKSMGNPTSDERLYNDYLGSVDHIPSINPYWLKQDGTVQDWRMGQLKNYPNKDVGYALLWNSGIPDWMLEQEPEIQKGRSLFTGFDIDNPLIRQSWSTIIKETGKASASHNATKMGFILSNEPHWYSEKGHWTQNFGEMTSISTYTLAKFQTWLSNKYTNIHELNNNWQTNFGDFQSVAIDIPVDPSIRGSAKWYDWCRFNMDRSIDWFTFLQNELHSVNPNADTSIKIMPDVFTENNRSHGIDLEALTELTTMIGDDAKTRGRDLRSQTPEEWEAHYAYFWEELAVSYDFMESVAPNKIHFNSETHFLSSSWWRELDTSPEYVRNTFWLATLMGMDAGLSWFWARDPDGSPEERLEGKLEFFDPAMAGSYAASTGMQPQVANELTQVMMDLNSYSEEIMALRKQRRPVRLFYSETSAINKPNHMTELFKMYEPLFFEGFPMGYATQNIIQKQDNSSWDVVVVYKTEYVTDAEFNALQSYLNNGGTVILDSATSLAKNEYGQPRQAVLAAGQGRLITMPTDADESDIKHKALEFVSANNPLVNLTEVNSTGHKACTWRVVKKPDGKGYWMTIVNLGSSSANLVITAKDAGDLTATDMLTGKNLGNQFDLASNGVLLLELN